MKPSACQENCPGCTILFVEDEPFIREVTTSMLERAGYYVLAVGNAFDAIQAFESVQQKVDLVLTDMTLPGRTGYQLAEDLRRHCPLLKVLVTSGYLVEEADEETFRPHTYFLAKPYSHRALIDKIEMICGVMPRTRPGQENSGIGRSA